MSHKKRNQMTLETIGEEDENFLSTKLGQREGLKNSHALLHSKDRCRDEECPP